MKTALLAVCSICLAGHVHAQGSLEFLANLTGTQEVPANASANHGTGRFTLTGQILEWGVALDAPWFEDTGGFVHGPAAPGSIAPVRFDLGNRFSVRRAPEKRLAYGLPNDEAT